MAFFAPLLASLGAALIPQIPDLIGSAVKGIGSLFSSGQKVDPNVINSDPAYPVKTIPDLVNGGPSNERNKTFQNVINGSPYEVRRKTQSGIINGYLDTHAGQLIPAVPGMDRLHAQNRNNLLEAPHIVANNPRPSTKYINSNLNVADLLAPQADLNVSNKMNGLYKTTNDGYQKYKDGYGPKNGRRQLKVRHESKLSKTVRRLLKK
jgi:hypothetical protein